ncbi:tRNA lysidine(34) synthetase TilS [Hyphomicrobium sp. 99]|uniref:tRNA lysidine(34) synthetase TilS n=1 Tax=Hyphomicrobium sp. 99 TaxID=1163419 RepID=UPI0005F7E4EF|nr:tRNA lysidine(34) synthetase TilS [Hyphomicrobium sp. 99]
MSRVLPLPISEAEADAAFDRLARLSHVVLAVSGGPDSMALMLLAAEWRARAKFAGPSLSVATVDHGLRPESRFEAELVGQAARQLDLPHAILTWEGAKPRTGVAAAAREARYRLLAEHARGIGDGNVAIATAHHLDDQAETFVMRLARGAGIDGLSGMRIERPITERSRITLARPLLGFEKARLVAAVAQRDVVYVEDPSNTDDRYERARVRSALSGLGEAGLSPQALATSARRLSDAREALAYAERHFIASLNLSFGNEVFATFDRRAFDDGPAFLRQKVMARLIARFGGDSPEPQLSEIEALAARLRGEEKCAATLGGAMVSAGPRFIRIWREAGRLDHSEVELPPRAVRIWDNRFALCWSAENSGLGSQLNGGRTITVKPLGSAAYGAILPRLRAESRPPARAAAALPSFWTGDQLVAAPSLAPFALPEAEPLDPAGFELTPLASVTS